MAPRPGYGQRPDLRVAWKAVLGPDDQYEDAYIAAVKVMGPPPYGAREVPSDAHGKAHLVIVAYPAAAHRDDRVRTEVEECCERHDIPPSRLVVVACGPAGSTDPLSEPPWLYSSCREHRWAQVSQPGDLEERILEWGLRIAERLEISSGLEPGDRVGAIIQEERGRKRWLGAK